MMTVPHASNFPFSHFKLQHRVLVLTRHSPLYLIVARQLHEGHSG